MGIEMTRLLACEPINWINMNADIEDDKNFPNCLNFQATQPKDKISHTKYHEGHKNL